MKCYEIYFWLIRFLPIFFVANFLCANVLLCSWLIVDLCNQNTTVRPN